jgi:hypothetical protein
VTDASLFIGPLQRALLESLRIAAQARPIHMPTLAQTMKTREGMTQYRAQMREQTITLPGRWDWIASFSIETGHPCGTARHLSVSIDRPQRVPRLEAVWMIARELGFTGADVTACAGVWFEDLADGGKAINVLQVIDEPAATVGISWSGAVEEA